MASGEVTRDLAPDVVEPTHYFVYVGTFTPEFHGIDGRPMGASAEGLAAFTLDWRTGAFEHVQTVGGMRSPSFVAKHPSLPVLYAVEREFGPEDREVGALTTLSIDQGTGQLEVTGRRPSGGKWPSYVSIHPSAGHAYVTNIDSGELAAFPLAADGEAGPCDAHIPHFGVGTHPRGDGPRTHSVVCHPSGSHVLVCNIGTNEVLLYATSEVDGALSLEPSASLVLEARGGPRHAVFHPSLPFAYVVNELNSTVTSLELTPSALTEVGTWPTLPVGLATPSYASEILISRNGRFVFVSNRGHDSIAAFEATAAGELVPRGHTATSGSFPRIFAITPNDAMLVAANQQSGTLVSFWLDTNSGSLEPTGHEIATPTPVSVAFHPISER